MHTINANDRVGKLAAQLPGASRVFMRHDVDFCCGGNQTLEDACEAGSLDLKGIIREIQSESSSSPDDAAVWEDRPLKSLVGHIIQNYHLPLRQELPRLLEMARKVHRAHGVRDPERLTSLSETVKLLHHDLLAHMTKEEQVLFPWILNGRGRTAVRPIRAMLMEHEDSGQLLQRLKELTDDFSPPRGSCTTWRALYSGLKQFHDELLIHIHLENNVLFPRALAGEPPTKRTHG